MSKEIREYDAVDVNNLAIEGESADFARMIGRALNNYHKQGTLVLHNLPNDLSRALVLGAWCVGWRVAILPPHLSMENQHLLLTQLAANLIVNGQAIDNFRFNHSDGCRLLSIDSIDQNSNLMQWLAVKSKSNNLDYPNYLWHKNQTTLVLFTSGSTGTPKGVCHSLLSILASAERFIQHFEISASDRLLNTALIHTMSGFRCSIMLPLLCGCQVNNLPIDGGLVQILKVLEQDRSTLIITGPNIIRQMSMLRSKIGDLTTTLRFILCTGAKLNVDNRIALFETLNLKVINYYGSTETGGLVIAESDRTYNMANQSIGKACADVNLKVINSEGEEHDRGHGELRVYCDSIFLGYLGQNLQVNRYFDTGDIVDIMPEDNVRLGHRIKSGVKATNTEWIYPETVDLWLRNHTLIADVHVSIFDDPDGRAKFKTEIVGIEPEKWQVWIANTSKKLLIDLGQHYEVITWHLVKSIERSNLGKYQKSIY